MHGLWGALVVTAALVCFARRRGRVAILALLVYHLHLLCDYAGSRGPDPVDKWPIFYFAPLSQRPMWIWKYQWPLFGWQNGVISIALFVWAMAMTLQRGDSIVGVFNRRADAVFVGTLRRWRESSASGLKNGSKGMSGSPREKTRSARSFKARRVLPKQVERVSKMAARS